MQDVKEDIQSQISKKEAEQLIKAEQSEEGQVGEKEKRREEKERERERREREREEKRERVYLFYKKSDSKGWPMEDFYTSIKNKNKVKLGDKT